MVSQDRLDQELQHIKTALQACQFPNWVLNQWHHRFLNYLANNNNHTNNTNLDNNPTKKNITLVVSFIPGTSEKFKKLCKAKGIQVHYKGTYTLRTLLGNPKDKDPKTNKSGVIYHYKCLHVNCPNAYIGESGRALGNRVKEHLKAPSPLHQHSTTTGDPLDPDHFNIVHRRLADIPGPSRKPCLSAFITPLWTGTWVNTNCCTYGTTYYRHHQHYSSGLPASKPPTPPH